MIQSPRRPSVRGWLSWYESMLTFPLAQRIQAVIALAERHKDYDTATLDRRHFSVVRDRRGVPFRMNKVRTTRSGVAHPARRTRFRMILSRRWPAGDGCGNGVPLEAMQRLRGWKER
jgi:hypothetical protein